MADELVRCRRRGLDRIDRHVGAERPLELPTLEALYVRHFEESPQRDRAVAFGTFIRRSVARMRRDRSAYAQLIEELFFGDTSEHLPTKSAGELLDAAGRRHPTLSVAVFRRKRRDAFIHLAQVMIDYDHLSVEPSMVPDDRGVVTATPAAAGLTPSTVGAVGLSPIQEQLRADVADEPRAAAVRNALAAFYRADLRRPILASSEARPEVRLPALGDAYVSPDFRVARVLTAADIVLEERWAERPCRTDLEDFLRAHLRSPDSAQGPLIVLGQPGAGKSVLTRSLAARLPAEDYVVVRVALRQVPADVDIQAQAEYAIRATTGETLYWPELMRGRGKASAVLLLDGFDELLQATGIRQSDYLERVAAFQQRQAALGHPVAVLVTTRTAMADHARCTPGTIALRIEQFSPRHVKEWLAVWNAANSDQLAERGLHELSPDTALATPELAYQPLLLLMLALYDADDNALQSLDHNVGHAELYERLLRRFAAREVLKDSHSVAPSDFDRAVEEELLQLSTVAFAMFNRGRQWITEAELDADMRFLLGSTPYQPRQSGDLRIALTPGQHALGRFFFVHEGIANLDGTNLRAFEFLHATFGEYLVGRMIVHELSDVATTLEQNSARSRPSTIDEPFLYALLSHAPLIARVNIVAFIREMLSSWPPKKRTSLTPPLQSLFYSALHPVEAGRYSGYDPRQTEVPRRHATYTCNLVVLLAIVGDGAFASELFPKRKNDCTYRWRNMALLWRSQLPPEGWQMLLEHLNADRIIIDDTKDVRISFIDQRKRTPILDMHWTYHHALKSIPPKGDATWSIHQSEDIRSNIHFLSDWRIDVAAHVGEPFALRLPDALTTFMRTSTGDTRSAANAIVSLWLTSGIDEPVDQLIALYQTCLHLVETCSWRTEERRVFLDLISRQLTIDHDRLPTEQRLAIHKRLLDIDPA